jgi:hypothetical protein
MTDNEMVQLTDLEDLQKNTDAADEEPAGFHKVLRKQIQIIKF